MSEKLRPKHHKAEESEAVLDRRGFLRGLAITAGITAIPFTTLEAFARESRTTNPAERIRERERVVENMVQEKRRLILSADTREAQHGRGANIESRILRALETPITEHFLRGTSFATDRQWLRHCVQISYGNNEHNQYLYYVSSGRQGQWPIRVAGSGFGYGNGVYYKRRETLVTAAHVAAGMAGREFQFRERDISCFDMRGVNFVGEADQPVHDDGVLSNVDINGALVTVEGYDPDHTAGANGRKSYPSMALKVHRGLAERLCGANSPFTPMVANSFMIVLPAGEAHGTERPATGMSGSPVFLHRNGEKIFAGIFFASHQLHDPLTNRTVDIGFFHGIEEVRAEYRNPTV